MSYYDYLNLGYIIIAIIVCLLVMFFSALFFWAASPRRPASRIAEAELRARRASRIRRIS